MPSLTGDRVQIEQMLCARVRDTLLGVSTISTYANVELRERFPSSDDLDEAVSTKPDLAQSDLRMTSIIQIGIPSVSEKKYTSENQTQLTFSYPITFDMSVKDEWDDPNNDLEFTNSRALFMAIFMKAGSAIKADITLGFENCEHEFLQQDSASTVEDEESGDMMHVADWSLVVHVKGVNI